MELNKKLTALLASRAELDASLSDKLRKSILQEAVQGKLVEQDPDDEPASVLLERIMQEKERLIKEKIIKRDKQESTIFRGDDNKYYEQIGKNCIDITADIPFDLPSNWVWTRIGNLFAHNNGKQLNKGNSVGTLMEYITTSNLYWDGFRPSNPQPIGFSGILLAKRQNSFYCTYFLHNRNVADTKSPYPIKRLEVIRWFNQKSMVFNQSLS